MNVKKAEVLAAAGEGTKSEVTLQRKIVYWIVVISSAVLLLWGWSFAIKSIIQGTTVTLG